MAPCSQSIARESDIEMEHENESMGIEDPFRNLGMVDPRLLEILVGMARMMSDMENEVEVNSVEVAASLYLHARTAVGNITFKKYAETYRDIIIETHQDQPNELTPDVVIEIFDKVVKRLLDKQDV